jgi:predicted nucleic acid-binding protein
LKQFRERRAKAKASQKKRKTTPVFRKIASDVVDAVEKAIKNVPAKQIKESPKVVIRKFGNLQKAADSFLKAFRDVLGADYQKSQAEVEINELKRLVENLIKKYSKK